MCEQVSPVWMWKLGYCVLALIGMQQYWIFYRTIPYPLFGSIRKGKRQRYYVPKLYQVDTVHAVNRHRTEHHSGPLPLFVHAVFRANQGSRNFPGASECSACKYWKLDVAGVWLTVLHSERWVGCDWWVGRTHLYRGLPLASPSSLSPCSACLLWFLRRGLTIRRTHTVLCTAVSPLLLRWSFCDTDSCYSVADGWCHRMALVHQEPSCVGWRGLHEVGWHCTLFLLWLVLPPSKLCCPVLLSYSMSSGACAVFLLGRPGDKITIRWTPAAFAPVCVPCGPEPSPVVIRRWRVGLVTERVSGSLLSSVSLMPAILNISVCVCINSLYSFSGFVWCTNFVHFCSFIFFIWVIAFILYQLCYFLFHFLWTGAVAQSLVPVCSTNPPCVCECLQSVFG